MKYALFTTIISAAFLYALGAFCAWDFNPGNWDIEGRIIMGTVWILISACGLIAAEVRP